MSEYQYYEFQAVDRPLTETEMQHLRRYSTRAAITPTSFVNHYEWGSFKGNTAAWMEKYFDSFLYLANWGTHELIFRIPRHALDFKTAKRYCVGDSAHARAKGDFTILTFRAEDEEGDWEHDGQGWLSSIIPIRAEIVGGDLRALYLAWLLCAQMGELGDNATEPPCPPGLGGLSASLKSFADFLRIDNDLIETAAVASATMQDTISTDKIERWVSGLSVIEKDALLVGLATRDASAARADILRRFREAHKAAVEGPRPKPRTAAELVAAAAKRTEERRAKKAKREAQERAHREREEAIARDKYLGLLADREPATWDRVSEMIAKRIPGEYDAAVALLKDLRDLAFRTNRQAEFVTRVRDIRDVHSNKPSLLRRLKEAGLIES